MKSDLQIMQNWKLDCIIFSIQVFSIPLNTSNELNSDLEISIMIFLGCSVQDVPTKGREKAEEKGKKKIFWISQ